MTNINTTATLAFGLIDNESREGFGFLAEGVNQLREQVGARTPSVTVTDKDDKMRGALRAVFPDAQQQICRFYISKNVLKGAKEWGDWPAKKKNDEEGPEGLREV